VDLPVVDWEGVMVSGLTEDSCGMIVDASGRLFVMGTSGHAGYQRTQFSHIPLDLEITSIAAKASYGFWLTTKNGELWQSTVWNSCAIKDFEKVAFPAFATRVFTDGFRSFHHSVLTPYGELYSMGDNYEGQLGVGDYNPRSSFVKVPGLEPIETVVSGYVNKVAIARSGNVYVTGSNIEGMIGLPSSVENTPHFIEIPILKLGVKQKIIAGSTDHAFTYLVSDNGDVFIAGGDKFFQFTLFEPLSGLDLSKIAVTRNSITGITKTGKRNGITGITKTGKLLYAPALPLGEVAYPEAFVFLMDRQVKFTDIGGSALNSPLITDEHGGVYTFDIFFGEEAPSLPGMEIIANPGSGVFIILVPIVCLPIGQDSCEQGEF
jgi:hypothetical protein